MEEKNIKEMLEHINEELQYAKQRDDALREALESGNMELIHKVDGIQKQLEEMAKGQLVAIVEQGERFMEELKRSNSEIEVAINLEALNDTVKIGKEELDKLLTNAFGEDKEVKALIEGKFNDIEKGLHAINENVVNVNDNVVGAQKVMMNSMDNGFKTILSNGLSHFASLKGMLLSTDKTLSELSYTVDRIPTTRGLQ